MFPTINKKETGVNLRRIMDMRGVKPKDIQEYLGLAELKKVWEKHPDLRLGQLICNIVPEDKLYYVEDDIMQEKIIYWDNK